MYVHIYIYNVFVYLWEALAIYPKWGGNLPQNKQELLWAQQCYVDTIPTVYAQTFLFEICSMHPQIRYSTVHLGTPLQSQGTPSSVVHATGRGWAEDPEKLARFVWVAASHSTRMHGGLAFLRGRWSYVPLLYRAQRLVLFFMLLFLLSLFIVVGAAAAAQHSCHML